MGIVGAGELTIAKFPVAGIDVTFDSALGI